MATRTLSQAKQNKADEFYTQLPDIEAEMRHYREQFKGKTILCNCDDPYESNFFKYFALNFNYLGLRKLVATCYAGSSVMQTELSLWGVPGVAESDAAAKIPYKIEISQVRDTNTDGATDLVDVAHLLKNKKNALTLLKGDGDFRSTECVELLKQADIVVTNPPFYVPGSPIRQEILENALGWKNKGEIEAYMSAHQHDPNANELWMYFKSVIDWVKLTFPKYRKEMKGVDWGALYDSFNSRTFDTAKLEQEIETLMMDDDVSNKKGIYPYVLTRQEKHLNIRVFTPSERREAYERQKGLCRKCRKQFELDGMEADHITPWKEGGRTKPKNCQMLCKECNRRKSDR